MKLLGNISTLNKEIIEQSSEETERLRTSRADGKFPLRGDCE